jgi:HlyD family secretion protein
MPGPPRRFRPQRRSNDAKKEGAGPKIWILEDGRPVARPVATGASDGVNTQIAAGDVASGQLVIVGQEETAK